MSAVATTFVVRDSTSPAARKAFTIPLVTSAPAESNIKNTRYDTWGKQLRLVSYESQQSINIPDEANNKTTGHISTICYV